VSRLWPVARREYVERVRSKAFVIATILGPIFMLVITGLPALLEAKQTRRALRVSVLDGTGELEARVASGLAKEKANGGPRFEVVAPPSSADGAALQREVASGSLDGYLRIPGDALESSVIEYHGRNVSDFGDIDRMQKIVGEAVVHSRLVRGGIAPDRVKALTTPLDLKTFKVSGSGEKEDRGGAFFLSFFMAFMLYMTVLMWGQAIMSGVIEEKTNRVVEIMVASIPPETLLGGKLLGIGAVGLTQCGVWTGCIALAGTLGGPALAAMGLLPEIPLSHVAALLVFFLLGYFLYAGFYASIGAAVNTQQEAQSLAFPAALPLILAFIVSLGVFNHPESTLTTVLSFVPLFTPLLMFARVVSQSPPLWQVGLSIALVLLTIVVVIRGAARVYRVGILMHGKRPTLPEILKWALK
jgi:ABC-2 type transport system permease protein